MKASLQLKYTQSLTMTPQLQQAIKLLQLSTLELQQEIQLMLESNPMLEQEDVDFAETEDYSPSDESSEMHDYQDGLQMDHFSQQDILEYSSRDTHDDVVSDPSQNEHWEKEQLSQASSLSLASDTNNFESTNSPSISICTYLLEQLNLCRMSDRDRSLAFLIIESIDEQGYFTTDINALLEDLNRHNDSTDLYELDEFLAVLHRVQQFEPAGIAAQNLQECLSIQLKQLNPNTEGREEALFLVDRYMDILGTKDFTQIRRKTKLNELILRIAIQLIQSLNPYPSSGITEEKTDYIVPDIIVRKYRNKWIAELNDDSLPKLRINSLYASYIKGSKNSSDGQFLKDNLQEAKWFIKSLQSRHETLLKVANEILRVQQDFFEYGPEAMKPLVLHDIAELVDMHESTISRVTTQKYLHSPKGVFELKYFFSSHVATDQGGECSSTAIRALIKKLVSTENRTKPLSDSKIATLLSAEGIQVARRTIAKYRESLAIPPSNERKQLF